jgi:nicotinate-nucleotide adenylyltransferase
VWPAGQAKNWTRWRLPALVLLRFRPDPTSATSLRAADPAWHRRFSASSPQQARTDKLQP